MRPLLEINAELPTPDGRGCGAYACRTWARRGQIEDPEPSDFIQFNECLTGPSPPRFFMEARRHRDGFLERVAGIFATTKGFTDFTAEPELRLRPVRAAVRQDNGALSGKSYARSAHETKRTRAGAGIAAFRVLADHARCVALAISDGILPGNEGREHVNSRRRPAARRPLRAQPGLLAGILREARGPRRRVCSAPSSRSSGASETQ